MSTPTVNERSSLVLTFDFTDEDDTPVIPQSVVWTLTDLDGTVINGRQGVAATPDTSLNVVLSGDDTALQSSADDGRRQVTVEAVYNSSLGSGLTLTLEAAFTVVDLSGLAAVGPSTPFGRLWSRLRDDLGGPDALAAADAREAVRDAVADFGRRYPRRLRGTLSVVAGQASYSLPDGFQRLVRLATPPTAGTLLRDSAGFLVPFGPRVIEEVVISGGQITLYPTPTYTLDLAYVYLAGYPYDVTADAFDGLTDAYGRIVLLKARSLALHRTATAAGQRGGPVSYQIGDTRVDRGDGAGTAAARAADLDAAYLAAIRALDGPIGRRGRERAPWA